MIRPMLISFGRASISIVPQHPAGSVSERKPSEINAALVRRSLPGAPLRTSRRGFHRSFPLVYRDRLAISYRDHAHMMMDICELSFSRYFITMAANSPGEPL